MTRFTLGLILLATAGCGDPSDPKALFEATNKDHAEIESIIRNYSVKPTGELTKEDLLKVEVLFLRGAPNRVSDIGPVRSLVNLKRANMQHNNITDLTPLYGLKKMSYIYLNDNPKLTMDDIEGLRAALPNCVVDHSIKKGR